MYVRLGTFVFGFFCAAVLVDVSVKGEGAAAGVCVLAILSDLHWGTVNFRVEEQKSLKVILPDFLNNKMLLLGCLSAWLMLKERRRFESRSWDQGLLNPVRSCINSGFAGTPKVQFHDLREIGFNLSPSLWWRGNAITWFILRFSLSQYAFLAILQGISQIPNHHAWSSQSNQRSILKNLLLHRWTPATSLLTPCKPNWRVNFFYLLASFKFIQGLSLPLVQASGTK